MVMNIFTPQRPFAILVVLVTSLLSSCAYLQPRQSEEAPAVAPSAQLPDGSIRVDTEDPQIARLWSAAEEARLQGNDAAALEHLYEALEVNPQNSLLWSRAAEVQLDNLEAAQAENFAIKSKSQGRLARCAQCAQKGAAIPVSMMFQAAQGGAGDRRSRFDNRSSRASRPDCRASVRFCSSGRTTASC